MSMARGFFVCPQTKNSSQLLLTSISEASRLTKFLNYPSSSSTTHLHFSLFTPSSSRFLCSRCSTHRQENVPIDMSAYSDTFAKRMAMAGLKPHHRIGQFCSPSFLPLFTSWVLLRKNRLKLEKMQLYTFSF